MADDPTLPERTSHLALELPFQPSASGTATVFVDGVQGLTVVNDVVKINFFQVIQDLPTDPTDLAVTHHREVVLRLILSPATLEQLTAWLTATVEGQGTATGSEGQVGADLEGDIQVASSTSWLGRGPQRGQLKTRSARLRKRCEAPSPLSHCLPFRAPVYLHRPGEKLRRVEIPTFAGC